MEENPGKGEGTSERVGTSSGCSKVATFSSQENGGLHDQLWPLQKTQELQVLFVFHCGLQVSLPTSLHALHLSCKESEGL